MNRKMKCSLLFVEKWTAYTDCNIVKILHLVRYGADYHADKPDYELQFIKLDFASTRMMKNNCD